MKEYLRKTRRWIHAHPELSGMEKETAAFIQQELDSFEITSRIVGEHSIIADLCGTKSGDSNKKMVALRADIDALPIVEANQVSYRSQNPGAMHACGHDSHTAMLLGAAKELKSRQHEFSGTIRFLFQEAEETLTGAEKVIADGGIDGVDCIIGMHVMPFIPVGTYYVKEGPMMPAGGGLEIYVHGQSGHASAPERVVNPIPVLQEIMSQINSMTPNQVSPEDHFVMVPTIIKAGVKTNIIPSDAYAYYNWRYYDDKYERVIRDKFVNAAKGIAEINGATAEVNYIPKTYALFNNPDYCDLIREAARNRFGTELREQEYNDTGSEDFALYLRKIPGAYVILGAMPEDGVREPHSECFDINEDALAYGQGLYVECALEALLK